MPAPDKSCHAKFILAHSYRSTLRLPAADSGRPGRRLATRSGMVSGQALRLIAACFFALMIDGSLWAQTVTGQASTSPSESVSVPAASPASASPKGAAKDTKLRLQGIRLAPYSLPRAGQVLTLQVSVANPSQREQAAQVNGRLETVANQVAAAMVRIPAGDTRIAELHLRLPPDLPREGSVTLNVSLNGLSAGEPILLDEAGQPQIDSLRLSLGGNQVMTAALLEADPLNSPEWYWPKEERLWSYEMAIAARIDASLSRQLSFMDSVSLPSQIVQWEQIDSLLLARDGPLRDAAAADAIVRWIADGGRAWVMLDRLDPSALELLLPDGMTCEVLDDVELNQFVVDADLAFQLAIEDRTVRVEQPLRLRRVTQSGGRVSHQIDGYPAAIWYTIGKGFLLVTTLEARGWLEDRSRWVRDEVEYKSSFQLRKWAQAISDNLFVIEETTAPIDLAEVNYPLRQIGNPILDRRYALMSVFGFCGLLSLAGVLCWSCGRLAMMGWIAPLLAVATAVPTLVAGSRQQQAIPDTAAHFQLIEVLPGSRSVQGSQWTTTYNTSQAFDKLTVDGDAVLTWSQVPPTNDSRKTLWADFQQQVLSSTAWPHGLWSMRSRFALPRRELEVVGHIDERGLQLQMPKELGHSLEDPIVQYVAGDVAVCPQKLEAEQAFYLSDSHLTADQSWLGTAIVNDEQSRREELYRQIPARGIKPRFPSYPALMGWTELWKTPLAWQSESSESADAKNALQPIERGAALLVLPIKLLPVQSGQAVTIPHTLIQLTSPFTGNNRSSAFANASGLWRDETTLPAKVPLRFELPPQVGPLEAAELYCDFKIRAPQREVLLTSTASGAQPVATLRSPLGAQRIDVRDPAILADARDGILEFVLQISAPLNLEGDESIVQAGAWQVEYVRISLRGRTLER